MSEADRKDLAAEPDELAAMHREVVASMRADRLIYADELADWLTAIGKVRWPTHRVRRMLARPMPDGEPLGFQVAGRRSPWATTWGTLFTRVPRLAARLLTHVGGEGPCPVCGRGGLLGDDGDM